MSANGSGENHCKLVFEEFGCWGCGACEVACKQEHNLPSGTYDPKGPESTRYVSLRQDGPKYVDGQLYFMYRLDVCRHCSDPVCVKACPENAMEVDRETGIVLHDKMKCTGCNAVPGKSDTEKQGASPCRTNCPAGNDVQGYASLAGKGEYRKALELIKETSPFPSVCGRVCHHPCESDCNRSQIDEAVSIQSIERFLADRDAISDAPYVPSPKTARVEPVAIIGSGPAGLSAAYFLTRQGYRVTVFEKLPVAGGLMRVAIPEYRLPREIVSRDIAVIEKLGVKIRTGVDFGIDVTFDGLREDGYRAVFVATGLHRDRGLGVEGEALPGVVNGIAFLRDVALGKPTEVGSRVVVVGGGNVAIDVALTCLRKGAKDVTVVYRSSRQKMKAWKHEIAEALEEGVKVVNFLAPAKFLAKDGRLTAVEFVRNIDVPVDTGATEPQPERSDRTIMEADTAILAIGQTVDPSFAARSTLHFSDDGRVIADPITLQTSIEGVFAGGDALYGPKSIADAIGSGREAAISIDRYIRGLSLGADRKEPQALITRTTSAAHDPSPRAAAISLPLQERLKGFAEVRLGLPEETVVREGRRCLSCGCSCIQACPYRAIVYNPATAKVQKCDLCHHRVTHGLYPACADNVCLAHCVYFDDPSNIEKLIEEKRRIRGGWGETIPKEIIYESE